MKKAPFFPGLSRHVAALRSDSITLHFINEDNPTDIFTRFQGFPAKTPGFRFEGVMRESGVNEQGEFRDERLYAILRRGWLRPYDKSRVTVLP